MYSSSFKQYPQNDFSYQAWSSKKILNAKHIVFAYSLSCEYVVSVVLCILRVDTSKNLHNIFTKGLGAEKCTAICNYSLAGDCSAERKSYNRLLPDDTTKQSYNPLDFGLFQFRPLQQFIIILITIINFKHHYALESSI